MSRFKFRWWDGKAMIHNKYLSILLNEADNVEGLMQYSGHKDDNDIKIYEGDIIEEEEHYEGDYLIDKRLLKVIFIEGSFMGKTLVNGKYVDLDFAGFTVIGNIFENKELLNG